MKDRLLKPIARRQFSDVAGICLSTLCIVHCLVVPVLFTVLAGAVLPLNGLGFLEEAGITHEIMFVLTWTFGLASVYTAARRGKLIPVICLAVGIVAVSFAEFFMHDLAVVRLSGTLCMIGGHLWAMRSTAISKSPL
jgi:hypothetical protein